MNNYKHKFYLIGLVSLTIIILLILLSCLFCILCRPISATCPDLSDNRYFIAHATGSIRGYKYMNSKETLINSLDKGYNKIEIDLAYTSDSVVVCLHDWQYFNKISMSDLSKCDSNNLLNVLTFKEFRKRKVYNRFTPLSLDDVISLQQQYRFIIVTDKISDPSSLNKYFQKNVRSSVIVEAFSLEDYEALKADGYVPMLSLGLLNLKKTISFIILKTFGKDIDMIVVDCHSREQYLRILKRLFNIKIAGYTTNSPSFFCKHLGREFDYIYTDNWDIKSQHNKNYKHMKSE